MRKIALVIGLQYSGRNKLNGCYNDALNIISTIKNIYKFKNDEIIYLNDKKKGDGTKSQIKDCLNYITSGNYDFVYFYYAGHGNYSFDGNSDESKLLNQEINDINTLYKDSYIVTNEGNNAIGSLKDDEIKTYLAKLDSKTTMIGMIDCCHSGTMFDCEYVYLPKKINNSTVKNTRLSYLLKNCNDEFKFLESKYKDYSRNLSANIVLISGARDKQYTFESNHDGKVQGNFTKNLCYIMRKLKNNRNFISINDLVLTVSSILNTKNQVPVVTSSKRLDLNKSQVFNNDYCANLVYNSEEIPNIVVENKDYKIQPNKYSSFWDLFREGMVEEYQKIDYYKLNRNVRGEKESTSYLVYVVMASMVYNAYKIKN